MNNKNKVVFKTIKDKQKYLESKFKGFDILNIKDKVKCDNCKSEYAIEEYKVQLDYDAVTQKQVEYIVCKYYPRCKGDIYQWVAINDILV